MSERQSYSFEPDDAVVVESPIFPWEVADGDLPGDESIPGGTYGTVIRNNGDDVDVSFHGEGAPDGLDVTPGVPSEKLRPANWYD